MRALAVVHPLPSSINATVVAVLALVAGADPTVAVLLAVAMLGFQVSIGCFNDVADEAVDRDARPDKPIPAGMVPRRTALAIAFAGAAAGLVISAGFGIIVLLLGAAGYASGLAYDFALRRIGWAWLAYALALPLLLLWTWQAAAGTLPPAWPFILPLAAVAGPALHLANSLVDVATDERTAVPSLATRLGATRARWTSVALSCGIYTLAWAGLLARASLPSSILLTGAIATAVAAMGLGLAWSPGRRGRETSWVLQAIGLALMGTGLIAAYA